MLLYINMYNTIVQDVHKYSVKHNLSNLSSMRDQTFGKCRTNLQETKRLNIANTDWECIQRRRRQGDDVVEENVDLAEFFNSSKLQFSIKNYMKLLSSFVPRP